jgi:hypothetical protein
LGKDHVYAEIGPSSVEEAPDRWTVSGAFPDVEEAVITAVGA